MTQEIRTPRLVLRRPRPDDAGQIAAFLSERDLPWNLGRAPYPYRLEHAEAWLPRIIAAADAGEEHAFMIERSGHAGLIGCCGLTRAGEAWELGYWLGKPHWGQGYVTEAAGALLGWAGDALGTSAFISGHIADNPASGRVLGKLGFARAGEISMFVTGRNCEVPAIRYVHGAPMDAALAGAAHGKPETP